MYVLPACFAPGGGQTDIMNKTFACVLVHAFCPSEGLPDQGRHASNMLNCMLLGVEEQEFGEPSACKQGGCGSAASKRHP